ncbi:HNH endonuclease signature motif containing protein [Chloroflexota bacterium]
MIKKECFICGSEESQENLHSHHIDWNHNNNDPDNVVALCKRCHIIIHQTGYASKNEMFELRKKVLSYKNDPFASKWGSYGLVYCLHCGDIYPENKAKWDTDEEIWRCKNYPDCSGAGIGYDLIAEGEIGEGGFQEGLNLS